MDEQWMPLSGSFEIAEERIVFCGGEREVGTKPFSRTVQEVGLALTNLRFSGGRISASFYFDSVQDYTSGQLVLYHDPSSGFLIMAGLGVGGMFSIRHFDGSQWVENKTGGDRRNFHSGQTYHVSAELTGSRVTLSVDGVEIYAVDLPWTIPESNVGVWLLASSNVTITDFTVESHRSKAFVVMEFSSPYNELYLDVLKQICEEFNLEVVRADEEYGPGIIVSDITRQILECSVVIADITPANPNVYYEVGYAHALNKPTILLAEKPTQLPFDVSPHRVLFYENTINGKSRLEEGLRRHLHAVLSEMQPGVG